MHDGWQHIFSMFGASQTLESFGCRVIFKMFKKRLLRCRPKWMDGKIAVTSPGCLARVGITAEVGADSGSWLLEWPAFSGSGKRAWDRRRLLDRGINRSAVRGF